MKCNEKAWLFLILPFNNSAAEWFKTGIHNYLSTFLANGLLIEMRALATEMYFNRWPRGQAWRRFMQKDSQGPSGLWGPGQTRGPGGWREKCIACARWEPSLRTAMNGHSVGIKWPIYPGREKLVQNGHEESLLISNNNPITKSLMMVAAINWANTMCLESC